MSRSPFKVVELTLLVEEAANLWSRVAKAHRDADEAEKAFEALSVRSWKDDEEATRVRKEWDELLQRDAETRQRILDLLGEPGCRGGRSAAQGAG